MKMAGSDSNADLEVGFDCAQSDRSYVQPQVTEFSVRHDGGIVS